MNYLIKKLWANFVNSINGLKIGLKEHSFILELLAAPLILSGLLWFDRPLILKITILIVYFLLLAGELFNTAIERLCDRITTEYDEQIKTVKDLSSAAVFLVLLLNVVLINTYLFF